MLRKISIKLKNIYIYILPETFTYPIDKLIGCDKIDGQITEEDEVKTRKKLNCSMLTIVIGDSAFFSFAC